MAYNSDINYDLNPLSLSHYWKLAAFSWWLSLLLYWYVTSSLVAEVKTWTSGLRLRHRRCRFAVTLCTMVPLLRPWIAYHLRKTCLEWIWITRLHVENVFCNTHHPLDYVIVLRLHATYWSVTIFSVLYQTYLN